MDRLTLGYKARTLLAKTAGVNITVGIVLLVCRITPGLPDAAASIIVGFLVLGGTGTVVAAIRTEQRGPAAELLAALLATPPEQQQGLRLVGSEFLSATRSSTDAGPESDAIPDRPATGPGADRGRHRAV